jgi:hypothetical protein
MTDNTRRTMYAKASINARDGQFWVEMADPDEWKRNWEESGVLE